MYSGITSYFHIFIVHTLVLSQQAITCSTLTIEILKQGVKYFQS